MLGGDLSNREAPILAFNIDELLFNDIPQNTTLQKIKYRLMTETSKFINRPINENFVMNVDRLWNKYSFSIYFVTFREDLVGELYELLDRQGICYTSLVPLREWDDLRSRCRLRYAYYFDRNEELLSYIGCSNALHIDKLSSIIR